MLISASCLVSKCQTAFFGADVGDEAAGVSAVGFFLEGNLDYLDESEVFVKADDAAGFRTTFDSDAEAEFGTRFIDAGLENLLVDVGVVDVDYADDQDDESNVIKGPESVVHHDNLSFGFPVKFVQDRMLAFTKTLILMCMVLSS